MLLYRDLVWVSKGYVLPIFVHVQGTMEESNHAQMSESDNSSVKLIAQEKGCSPKGSTIGEEIYILQNSARLFF